MEACSAWRDVVAALFRVVRPARVLSGEPASAEPDHPLAGLCREIHASLITGALECLESKDELADAIVLAGHASWHTVRHDLDLIGAAYERQAAWPLVVIVLEADDPIPSWLDHAARLRQERRGQIRREGVERAARSFAASHPPARFFWSTSAQPIGIVANERMIAANPRLSSLLAPAIDCEKHTQDGLELTLDMHEDLQQLARASQAVLDSGRYRLGNRIVRTVLRVFRKHRGLNAQKDTERLIARSSDWHRRLDSVIPARDVAPPASNALRVTYVLPQVTVNGGVLGVSQLANELLLLGVDARIAALRDDRDVYRWRFLRAPMLFASPEHLVASLPPCDLAVATHWTTAAWVRALVDSGRAKHGVYFLQDYEAWFFPESDPTARATVKRTYDLLAHKIVKSDWLAGLLRGDGHETHKIPIGLNLGFFHPRAVEPPTHPTVFAMARPRTPRRGFESVSTALAIVREAMPSVEIVLFGQDLSRVTVPFPYRGEGVIADQDRLAELYSGTTVHLDGSDFQAFGRPALEAMACGAASVLTDVGGVSDYARHEQNCLLVPPRQPRAFADAILRLLRDEPLRMRLREGGFTTVMQYCMKREARATFALFKRICGAAPAPTPATPARAP